MHLWWMLHGTSNLKRLLSLLQIAEISQQHSLSAAALAVTCPLQSLHVASLESTHLGACGSEKGLCDRKTRPRPWPAWIEAGNVTTI